MSPALVAIAATQYGCGSPEAVEIPIEVAQRLDPCVLPDPPDDPVFVNSYRLEVHRLGDDVVEDPAACLLCYLGVAACTRVSVLCRCGPASLAQPAEADRAFGGTRFADLRPDDRHCVRILAMAQERADSEFVDCECPDDAIAPAISGACACGVPFVPSSLADLDEPARLGWVCPQDGEDYLVCLGVAEL